MRFDTLCKHVARVAAELDPNWRGDANETMAFARQLEYIYAQTYDTLFPENKARVLLPVDGRIPSGAKSHTYRQMTEYGEAAFVNNFADDFPQVDLKGEEITGKLVSLGDSFGYSIQDLRGAAMGGIALDAEKAKTARKVMERKLDALACTGDTNTGLVGIANASGIIDASSGFGDAGVAWASATADNIRDDVNALWKAVFETTKGIYMPDTLALDPASYATLTTKKQSAFSDDNMMQYILKTNPSIRNIEFWPRLATADGSGGPRILCYKKDPAVVSLLISQEFEMMPPQAKNMAFTTACHMRTGGVIVRYPKAIAYLDTIG